MECLESIGLSPSYVNYASRSRITALVDPAWLEGAASGVIKPLQLSLKHPEEHLQRSSPDPPAPWRRVSIKVLAKRPGTKVQRLSQLRSISHRANYCELMAYVTQENYDNLWKHAWKRYEEHSTGCISSAAMCNSSSHEPQEYDVILESLVGELFGDRQKLSSTTIPTARLDGVQPAYAVLQTETAFCIVQPFVMCSLRELQAFSPAALGTSSNHLLFLCYQLLRLAHCCHARGLALGITSDDQVLMTGDGRDECFWMVAMPRIGRQLAALSVDVTARCSRNDRKPLTGRGHFPECTSSIEAWCNGWITGAITNFDYLMFLNKLAGRRLGDPNHHPVLPWIMDFTLQDGCYRDLCKSKFRLNKGDEQLDQMFTATLDHNDSSTLSSLGANHLESAGSAAGRPSAASTSPVTVPHHVSAILSDITYYTYMARRTPREVLCAHVRPKWVPNEYPASIERLQAWTPDECIPEFFTDPTIFVSIHDDLPDLKVPAWAGTPERFVELHMLALESDHVSQSLHQWIDLTFGYKLRGDAAVEAKNVCLQLVDGHRHAENHGIVQLFTRPHPARLLSSQNNSAPPRPPAQPRTISLPLMTSSSSQSLSGGISSPEVDLSTAAPTVAEVSGSPAPTGGSIVLPETFNPLDILERAERVWDQNKQLWITSKAELIESADSVEDLVDLDMMGIGCVMVKAIFPLDTAAIAYSDSDRSGLRSYYRTLREVARRKVTDIPKPLLNVVQVLMNLQGQQGSSAGVNPRQPSISSDGLPPICPGLLMHPLLQLVPFPLYYDALYNLACIQRRMETVIASAAQLVEHSSLSSTSATMETITHFCDGAVRQCLKAHLAFFTEHGPHLSLTGLELVMPYVLQLMKCDDALGGQDDDATTAAAAWVQRLRVDCAVQAAWTLFPYVSQVLGPWKTNVHLVPSLLRLYDSPLVPLRTVKCIKLYHKSFVQQLCAQLSLETFLAAGFLLRLAQGVAGLRDFDDTQGSHVYSTPEELHVEPAIAADEPSSGTDYMANDEDQTEEAEEAAEEDEVVDPTPEQDPGVGSEAGSDVDEPQPTAEAAAASGPPQHISFGLDGDEDEGVVKVQPPRTVHAPSVDVFRREQTAAVGDQAADDEYNVRHVAADCMSWLCERLGPVLAVRHASEALLQTLKDCYNMPHAIDHMSPEEVPPAARLFMSNKYVVGDVMAAGVLQCLVNMTALYGEQFVLIHYFNYIVYLVQAFDSTCCTVTVGGCKGGTGSNSGPVNRSLEAGLLACITLLAHMVACLTDTKLLEVLEKSIMGDLLTPLIQTVSSAQRLFPTGALFRSLAAFRIVDVMVLVSIRIGFDQTRQYMCPVLKQFFSSFNVHANVGGTAGLNPSLANPNATSEGGRPRNRDVSEYVQIKQSALDRNNFYVGSPVMIGMSPSPSSSELVTSWEPMPEEVAEELRLVFSHELAQYSYVRFCKLAGGIFLQTHLVNEELISRLSAEYDEQLAAAAAASTVTATAARGDAGNSLTTWFVPPLSEPSVPAVEVIGNKLSCIPEKERLEPKVHAADATQELRAELRTRSEMMANTVRHLKGNWLAYCEHEWGLDKCDTAFRFKQIHLQDFRGHAGSVRSMQVLDNENSFVTGSKDKTVKLWSLRNVGDGNARCNCQYTYTGHRRTVLSVAYMESVKLVASLDGSVHLWDPFFGTCVRQYEVSRIPGDATAAAARVSGLGASAMQLLFAPSPLLVAATAECSLRLLDVRVRRFVQELRTWQHGAASTAGTISGLAVSHNNMYVAAASTSGYVSVLDLRTGFPQGAWKAHDGEILQIRSFNDKCFVTSSMDSTVTMWRYDDVKPVINLRGHSDPVRCIRFHNNSMISATTANKIGVHSSIVQQPMFYCEKLRADSFKGVLTTMAVLPLNKLLLLGADNGTISLFA